MAFNPVYNLLLSIFLFIQTILNLFLIWVFINYPYLWDSLLLLCLWMDGRSNFSKFLSWFSNFAYITFNLISFYFLVVNWKIYGRNLEIFVWNKGQVSPSDLLLIFILSILIKGCSVLVHAHEVCSIFCWEVATMKLVMLVVGSNCSFFFFNKLG